MEPVNWDGTPSFKSWAQQTEESYQLQLALALRLSSQAASTVDSDFLNFSHGERAVDSAEIVSHRFWVNGCLSYSNRIPDGFYMIHGMDPYAWAISTREQDSGRIPSFESLEAIDPTNGSLVKVVLINKSRDPRLYELHNKVLFLSRNWFSIEDAIYQLANLVCNHMGGAASKEGEILGKQWKESAEVLEECFSSIVIPIGNLSIGLCVHRALLFKALADTINIPCRIAKGCKYCRREDASSCLVKIGYDGEYMVDLIGEPGALSQPDSSLNGAASVRISSPLCHPKFKASETAENFKTLAELYFRDWNSQSLSGNAIDRDPRTSASAPEALNMQLFDRSSRHESNMFTNVSESSHLIRGPIITSTSQSYGNDDAHAVSAFSRLENDARINQPYRRREKSVCSDLHLEGLDIPWSELELKEPIGEGSFGAVHRAEWRNSEVAVKILMEQEFHAERFEEFLREVAIMRRLLHPNIVLFMGAVTQPPHLSIVTEYLPRGSLYKLLRMPDARVVLDERLRLNMAFDVAQGMNYLHQLRPPIVHRDLKSPNLLVDANYTVKVCDFGLSRSKANTYLSSKTAAGTPEWMAPEVLRDDPSNEKSDVYSFGVILWELVTLQQPWRNMDPTQVIGAVGFRGKRLEIPNNVDPVVASLIRSCWEDEPSNRPSFYYIIGVLQQLLMSPVPRPFFVQK